MTILAISVHADFEPEGLGPGLVTWTLATDRTALVGAGLYEIRPVRPLTDEEFNQPWAEVLRAAQTGEAV
jgi:hypothetical protein